MREDQWYFTAPRIVDSVSGVFLLSRYGRFMTDENLPPRLSSSKNGVFVRGGARCNISVLTIEAQGRARPVNQLIGSAWAFLIRTTRGDRGLR